MKNFLLFIFMLIGLVGKAQTTEFDAAAKAFEDDEPAKSISLLSQMQLKTGPNPRIESLRALAYEQLGDKEKAYNSTLLYFKMAGRNHTGEGNKDMLALESSLKKALQSEMDQKKKTMEQQWTQENNQVIQPKYAALQTVIQRAQQTSDDHFNKLITKQELTADDITLIKANIKTEAAQKLDANVLKINTIKFTKILDLGNGIEPLLDPFYTSAIDYLKSHEYAREIVKKEKGVKLKKDADYVIFLASLKNDLRSYLNIPGTSYDDNKRAAFFAVQEKYIVGPSEMKITCSLSELLPIIGDSKCEIACDDIGITNGKITRISASKTLADPVLAFTNTGIFDLDRVGEIKKILEAKYGLVDLKVVTRNQERNYAKFTDYEYRYTIETKTLWYKLTFYFGPYGRENGNRDVINGSTLRIISITLTKKPD